MSSKHSSSKEGKSSVLPNVSFLCSISQLIGQGGSGTSRKRSARPSDDDELRDNTVFGPPHKKPSYLRQPHTPTPRKAMPAFPGALLPRSHTPGPPRSSADQLMGSGFPLASVSSRAVDTSIEFMPHDAPPYPVSFKHALLLTIEYCKPAHSQAPEAGENTRSCATCPRRSRASFPCRCGPPPPGVLQRAAIPLQFSRSLSASGNAHSSSAHARGKDPS